MRREARLPWVRQSLKISWAIVVRGAGSLLKFVMNLLLARVLGASGTGLFYLFQSWGNVMSIVGGLGLSTYTLRSVSVLEAGAGGHAEARSFLSKALKLGLWGGAAILITPFVFSSLLAGWLLTSPEYGYIIQAAAVCGLGVAMLMIFTQALTGRGQVITAMQLESAAVPAVMITFLALALVMGKVVSAATAIVVYLAALLLTIALAGWFWSGRAKAAGENTERKPSSIPVRYADLASFWGASIVSVAGNNVAILALPFFASTADIGRFSIAQRMATMSATILDALANIFVPAFAREYARRNASGLLRELLLSQLYSFVAYLPFVFLFVFFAKPILGVVGEDFIAANRFLMILMLGQLFNSATGLAGNFLNMVHRQHITFYVSLGQFLFTAGVVYVMGSSYGALGIAIAVSVSVALKNLVFYILARIYIHEDKQEWGGEPA